MAVAAPQGGVARRCWRSHCYCANVTRPVRAWPAFAPSHRCYRFSVVLSILTSRPSFILLCLVARPPQRTASWLAPRHLGFRTPRVLGHGRCRAQAAVAIRTAAIAAAAAMAATAATARGAGSAAMAPAGGSRRRLGIQVALAAAARVLVLGCALARVRRAYTHLRRGDRAAVPPQGEQRRPLKSVAGRGPCCLAAGWHRPGPAWHGPAWGRSACPAGDR